MIGIGIFTTTGFNAENLNSPAGLFLLWILGGLYAFCGALTYAELGTRFPEAGGDYLFLKNAYHPLAGFLFGWSTFTVTYTGSIAAIAIGFAAYFIRILPEAYQQWQLYFPLVGFSLPLLKIIALAITLVLTILNSFGIRKGARFQNIFTLLGITTLLFIIILGFSSAKGSFSHFQPFFPETFSGEEISLLGVALVGVIFTYSGWTVLVYIAGEIKNPRRNIPGAMGIAVVLVGLLYMLMNAVYLYAQSLRDMSGTVEIGYQTLKILFAEETSLMFSLVIMLMVLSSLNATVLSGARVYYAMAREKRFFKPLGKLHPRYRVPVNSLWVQFVWVVILILIGRFDELLTYTVFVMVVFSFLSGVALFVLRKKEMRGKPSNAVYHAWGYPVVPIIYLAISGWLMINTLYHRPLESLGGIAIVLLGVPFYLWWNRNEKQLNE
jgi:APA family basic amino acid/polyamine antiporter